MDYIQKLFKQHPFIYRINGHYYAFGTGVCIELDERFVTLKSRYERYLLAMDKDMNRLDAWQIFHKLMAIADNAKSEHGYEGNELIKFQNFNFTSDEIDELKTQVEQYITYFRKHRLQDYL